MVLFFKIPLSAVKYIWTVTLYSKKYKMLQEKTTDVNDRGCEASPFPLFLLGSFSSL